MNLKSNIINNAIAGFINMFKRGNNSFIVKRLSAFVLSLIIFVSSVFCQYCTAVVSAAEVGAIVAVDLVLELAITGGIVAGIIKSAEILQGEISSGTAFGSDGLDEYALNVNGTIIDGVADGTITNAQAGTVNKVSGVPVEIICPFYGIYQFLCTNELCNKIKTSNPQSEAAVKEIVNAYWSSVNVLDQRTFEEIAADPHNWITSLDALNYDSIGMTITSESIFDTYGDAVSEPDSAFFTTGKYCHAIQGNWNSDYNITVAQVESCNDFVFLKYYSTFNNTMYLTFGLYGHLTDETDPNKYTLLKSNLISRAGNATCNPINGVSSLTLSDELVDTLGFTYNTMVTPLDMASIIDNWGQTRGIEATDAIDLIDWCWGDSRFWNTDILDLAIDTIADAVDVQIDTGDDAVTDIPITLPVDIPVEGVDIPFPGTDTEEDFDDPLVYPRTDEWLDVDTDVYPPSGPSPDDPDDPDDPDNPSGGDPPELPPVNIPALLGLFPFCIPFDIKKAIEWFETDDGSDPVFYIPIDINLSGRQIIDYDLEINLTQHGIRTVVIFLKSAQVVAYVIVLGYATSKVIY